MTNAVAGDEQITCAECGMPTHAIQMHLKKVHPEMTIEAYQERYPLEPIFSPLALRKIEEAQRQGGAQSNMAQTATATVTPIKAGPSFFHDIFELDAKNPQVLSSRGTPIPCTVLPANSGDAGMVPDIDPNYVFDIEILKSAVMALELNIPLYLWGHKGGGKTTLPHQIAARTKRPLLRVNHTLDMESRDVVGQWTAINGETKFLLGPLPMAMMHGWLYLADEYDYGLPSVLGVYQAVLEGKSLVIKEAPHDLRVIKPHPNFRFVATGNTNGSGDETGLYQGTNVQNAANYDRFGVVVQVHYPDEKREIEMLMKQAQIGKPDAERLVKFANKVREAYESNKIANIISPRGLIIAAQLGIRRGNWRTGIALAFSNKLSKVDREVVDQLAQREFGS